MKKIFLLLFIGTYVFASCNYKLDIRFDFEKNKIEADVDIKSNESLQLSLEGFFIKNEDSIKLLKNTKEISFSYEKDIKDLDEKFIYLLQNWYPRVNRYCSYEIKTNLPNSYKQVYENSSKEIGGIHFIASKDFVVASDKYKDVELKTYFLRDDKKLVEKYMKKIKEYLTLYERVIDKYPFKEFKVVENIHQTGYAMPTYTLIGSRLLGKDYILNQSLGHELLHQYFGSSVFCDYEKGNWLEGITTYLADDYYKKLEKKDIEHRKNILNQVEIYVNKDEFPINEFRYRYDKNSSLIGYSKLSFVFHMLEKRIGQKNLENLIKRVYQTNKFKELSLDELAKFIEDNTKEDLATFFNQWLYKKGKIAFSVENIKYLNEQSNNYISFDIVQNSKNSFEFYLPIYIKTQKSEFTKKVLVNKKQQNIKIELDSKLNKLVLDRNYDLYRALDKKERVFTVASILEQKELLILVDKKDSNKYKAIEKSLKNSKLRFTEDIDIKDIKNKNILLLGSSNKFAKDFLNKVNIESSNSYIIVDKNKFDDNSFVGVLNLGEYKQRYLMMLKYYAKYSKVVFSKEKSVKMINKSENGIELDFKK